MEAVIVAVFGSITGFFAWRASVHSKGTRDDIQTNHGKRPGEYLEMSADIPEIAMRVSNIEAEQAKVAQELAAHTIQDATNFGLLTKLMLTAKQDV